MITKLLPIFFLFALNGCTKHYVKTEKLGEFDQEKIRKVAIFPFRHDQMNMGVAISEALATEFLSFGFDAVERTQLNSALQELHLDLSGAIGEDARKRIGEFLGVDAVVFGSVTSYIGGWIYTLDLRLVDVKSGDILWSTNYLNKDPVSLENPRQSIQVISESIRNELFKTVPCNWKRIHLVQNRHVDSRKYGKIALLPMAGTNYVGEGKSIDGVLTTEFLGNKVKLVERESLDKILFEQFRKAAGFYVQGFEQPMVKERKDVKRTAATKDEVSKSTESSSFNLSLSNKDIEIIGKLTGADGIVIGSFSPAFPYNKLFAIGFANLRLLDIETGRIVWSATYYNDNMWEDVVKSAEWLAIAMCPVIKTDNLVDRSVELYRALKRKKIWIDQLVDVFPSSTAEEEKARLGASARMLKLKKGE